MITWHKIVDRQGNQVSYTLLENGGVRIVESHFIPRQGWKTGDVELSLEQLQAIAGATVAEGLSRLGVLRG